MAGNIDMVPDFSMDKTEESSIQRGGSSSGIDMLGGEGVMLSHTPVGSAQSGKGASGIDMIGEQGLFSPSPANLYGQSSPTDKGKV